MSAFWKNCICTMGVCIKLSQLKEKTPPLLHIILFWVQICVKHNSMKPPFHPPVLLLNPHLPPHLCLCGGTGRSGIPLFMSISCFFFCWRSCFSRSAFSFASLALLIFSSISLFLWFSFTASWWGRHTHIHISTYTHRHTHNDKISIWLLPPQLF